MFSVIILYYFQDNNNNDDNNNNNLPSSKFDLEQVKSGDSTDSGKVAKSAAKKLRLPYGPVKINAYKAESFWQGNRSVKKDNAGGRKRKYSDETFGHTDTYKTPTSNTHKSGVLTPKSSPVLDGLRRKIRVEMARLSVQVY